MSDKKPTDMTLEELMATASSALYSRCSSVLIVTIEDPSHDAMVGKVRFIRRGEGPAYNLMMNYLEYELDLASGGADEVDGEGFQGGEE
jgi:hypothetical protein